MKGGGKALWKDENIADTITSHAIRFIEENKERPFFILRPMMYMFPASHTNVSEVKLRWDYEVMPLYSLTGAWEKS